MNVKAALKLAELDGQNGFVINGPSQGSALGRSLSNAGDVNGDGIDDVIISTQPSANESGFLEVAYVVYGSSSGFDTSFDLATLDGSNGFIIGYPDDGADGNKRDFGVSVSGAGDVNGDGFDDVIVGAPAIGAGAGTSHVVFGSEALSAGLSRSASQVTVSLAALDGTNGFTITRDHNKVGSESVPKNLPLRGYSDGFGSVVSSAGDINGDGFGDVMIAAPGAYPDGTYGNSFGASYVVLGQGNAEGAIAASIDVSELRGDKGFVIKGADSGFSPYSYDINAVGSSDSVDGLGDFNGDGFDDVIISGHDLSYVVFGTDAGFDPTLELTDLDGQNGFTVSAGIEGTFLGYSFLNVSYSVSGAGDINGDGLADLVVDADLGGYAESGKSYVVFGRIAALEGGTMDLTQLDGSDGFVVTREVGGYSSDTVSGAGDVNGDGFGDLMIGVSGVGNGYAAETQPGKGYVLFGKATGFDAVVDLAALGERNGFVVTSIEGADFAKATASSADIDNDGLADTIWGAPAADKNGEDSGASYIVFGRKAEVDEIPDGAVVVSGDGQPFLGRSRRDVIIGSDQADIIHGLGGRDEIQGNNGDDHLIGGLGRDVLTGDDGNDLIEGQQARDLIEGGAGNDTLFGNQGSDFIDGGEGDDQLIGGRGKDELLGGGGNDTIEGGIGGDRISGGTGNDVMTGGGGKDTFVFDLSELGSELGSEAAEGDRITDFRRGQDVIELKGGLSFGDLTFEGERIAIAATGQVIVSLTGVDTATLSAADFV